MEYQIDSLERTIRLQQDFIKKAQSDNSEQIANREKQIQSLHNDIEKKRTEAEKLEEEIRALQETTSDEGKVSKRKIKILDIQSKLESKVSNFDRELGFFEKNDNCPTCEQEIDDSFKEKKFAEIGESKKELEEALSSVEKELIMANDRLNEIAEINRGLKDLSSKLTQCTSDIRSWESTITMYQSEIEKLRTKTSSVDEYEEKIEESNKELIKADSLKKELTEEREVLSVSKKFLTDTGIKTKIIKQYIPVINQTVNRYLQALNFFVAFELDEKFNETIKSRHRDPFKYASFSEGEKFRIDISLMLTWREIAKLRNSAATNLLIMDEVFDGSADYDAVDSLMEILRNMEGSSIFVISHSEKVIDKIEDRITFKKVKNFSKYQSNF